LQLTLFMAGAREDNKTLVDIRFDICEMRGISQ
jgi:hypothetical protein